MAEHIGIVTESQKDGLVRVTADRKGACGGCAHTGDGCRACLSGSHRMESEAANPVGAKTGDLVKLEMSFSGIFTGTALLYVFPVLALVIGAFLGNLAYGTAAATGELGPIAGAFLGFLAGCGILAAADRSRRLRGRFRPTITRIVKPGTGAPPPTETTGNPASCCS